MSDEEKMIGRINAVVGASEDVISRAKKVGSNEDTIRMAKEVAYDHIREIIKDVGYVPWHEITRGINE